MEIYCWPPPGPFPPPPPVYWTITAYTDTMITWTGYDAAGNAVFVHFCMKIPNGPPPPP